METFNTPELIFNIAKLLETSDSTKLLEVSRTPESSMQLNCYK